jgi:YgiT-type zinc finger domain-containing protein
MEAHMKCSLRDCPGEYEERKIVQAEQHGDRIIVINGVPAEICSVCGDVLFTMATVRRIEAIVRDAGTPDSVAPVYDYAVS